MLKTILTLTLISMAQSATWDYLNSGVSWVGANNGTCATTNTNQSPINALSASATLSLTTRGGVINLPARGTTQHVDETNNGHTIVISPESATDYLFSCDLKVEGDTAPVKFNALQFHFHAPSENYIDGVQGQLEMHFVMKCDSCAATAYGGFTYAVLGFVFRLDAYAPDMKFLKTITTNIPKGRLLEKYTEENLDTFYMRNMEERELATAGATTHLDLDINEFFDNVPSTYQFLNFRGGLTTPPCSQVVNWFLAREMIPVNAAQLKFFTDLWVKAAVCTASTGCGNNRLLQDVKGRGIFSSVNTINVASSASKTESSSGKTWLIVILIVVCLLLLIMLVATIFKAGASGAKADPTYKPANQKPEEEKEVNQE